MQKFRSKPFILGLLIVLLSIPLITVAQDDDTSITYAQLSTDDGISLFYPADWTLDVGEGDAFVFIYNNDAIIERANDAPFESGDVSVYVSFTPTEYAHLLGFIGDTVEERLTNLANGLVILNNYEEDTPQMSISDITVLAASNVPDLQYVTYSLTDVADGMIVMWDISDDLLGTAIVTTAPDELDDIQDIVLSIMQSTSFDTTIDALRNGGNQ